MKWDPGLWFRPPRDLRLLIHTRYRDPSAPERYKRVTLAPEWFDRLKQSLISAPEVREVRIYEERFRSHKSYAEDFEIDEKLIEELANAAKYP